MGLVSDEFARARRDRWIAKKVKPGGHQTGLPWVERPIRSFARFFMLLNDNNRRLAVQLSKVAHRLPGSVLQAAHHDFEARSKINTRTA